LFEAGPKAALIPSCEQYLATGFPVRLWYELPINGIRKRMVGGDRSLARIVLYVGLSQIET
jgi:hypothetical protein